MFFKKLYFWLLALSFFCSGCVSDGVPLFNSRLSLWGSRPDYVIIQKGDTLYSISKAFDVPMREVIEANNLKPPYTLAIGMRLTLPHAKYYVVEKGDTVYSISKRHNIDMNTFSKLNDLEPPYALRIGQRLLLPDTIVDYDDPPATKTYAAKKSTTTTAKTKSSAKKATAKKTSTWKSSSKSTVAKKRSSKFSWPVKGKVISKYGVIAKGRNNDGINIKAPLGTAVKAADGGTVAYAGNELKGFGNLILIRHNDGWITAYAHNDRLLVKKGQKVSKGSKIATVGSTGGVNTPQLHFEIRAGKKAVNPLLYLK